MAQLYGRCAESPSKATIWRVITGADAAAVDAVIGAWLARQSAARESDPEPSALAVAIAVDGKTVRGATDTEGNQVHLLAAATHTDALVLGQVEVGAARCAGQLTSPRPRSSRCRDDRLSPRDPSSAQRRTLDAAKRSAASTRPSRSYIRDAVKSGYLV